MSTSLSKGATAGGYKIITSKEIPIVFRKNGIYLEYSNDGGITWKRL